MSDVVNIIQRPRCPGISLRRMLIAKIHVAKKQLALEDDSYRAILQRVTGKSSSADMSTGQLESVLKEFIRLGFTGTHRTAKPARKGGLPTDDQARKIRALWLNLYHLGEIRESSEEALVAYCRRMSGVAAIEWMHPEQFDRVIRGLLGWLERIDWSSPTAETIRQVKYARAARLLDSNMSAAAIAAKGATIRAQYALLGLPIDGDHPELLPSERLDPLICELGVRCRAAKAQELDQ